MILVIAGDYKQARWWMNAHHLEENKDAIYISRPDKLRGIQRGSSFVKIGDWYRKTSYEIYELEKILRVKTCKEIDEETLAVLMQ